MSNTVNQTAISPSKPKQKPVKCVVWDLDHTIWHGVLLENDQLVLREGIIDIIKTLDSWGIINSIASKNNHDDAVQMLEKFGLREYFLYPQINWDLKSNSLKKIKEKLNIGMDAIVFIDDQPFERDEVAFVHEQITCLDVDVIEDILRRFKPRFITEESSLRRKMYLDDDVRNQEEQEIGNNRQFLESLQLSFSIQPATIDDLQRVEELTLRTNQLNATGYSYSYEELEMLVKSPNHLLLVAELTDKYGSYGKIGVAMVECNEDTWTLKLLLMSCRVMSRGVGAVLLNYIMNRAKAKGCSLQAEFLPTDRNRMMYIAYKFAGFTEAGKLDNGGQLLTHPLTEFTTYPDYINISTQE
ncbi:MAG TPA: HAD-IIIC family phosphatase [Chitinophaga sp.]|uniref:HAD-IIIC family phosphatase n=1 Tax=Chitinophaga sp. TaxID=1869181 RepID=UPI002CB3FA77|nr:HAD-IIIC family phosphatase [Chitinophaga sp.]HVI45633.1 HAD-IIIC family phosphatase [Chitinophaga sp.]